MLSDSIVPAPHVVRNCGARVGIICQNDNNVDGLGTRLSDAGFELAVFHDGEMAIDAFDRQPPETAIVDLALCKPSGSEVLRRIRSRWNFPVIVLAERGDEVEEVFSFRLGADDYVSSEISGRALAARVQAGLRRRMMNGGDRNGVQNGEHLIKQGWLQMDESRHAVHWRECPVTVTQTEFQILRALASRPGFVKTREQLMDVAYPEADAAMDRTIDSHIKRLRKKLRAVDPEFAAICTLYGVGYKFLPAPEV